MSSRDGRRGRRLRHRAVDQILEALLALRVGSPETMTCSRSAARADQLREPRIERLRHHQHAGAAVGQHEAVVVLGHQRVDRHGDDAGLEAAEERGRPVDGVEQRDQHALLAAHAERAQHAAKRATRSASWP